MAFGKNKKNQQPDRWWEAQQTDGVVDESQRTLKKRFRWLRGYLWIAVFLVPLMALGNLMFLSGALNPTIPEPEKVTLSSPQAAMSEVALQKWLAQTPSPLPGGKVLAYLRTDSVQPPVDKQTNAVPYTILTAHYFLQDKNFALYEATVQSVQYPDGNLVIMGTPGLVPLASNSEGSTAGAQWPWPGVDTVAQNDAAATAIQTWASAYTSGDPAKLKQVVGDPSEQNFYQPMAGVTLSSDTTIQNYGALWGADQKDHASNDKPRMALVRVSLGVAWAGQPESAGNNTRVTFDLLLDKADTGAPVVVAWGGPGQTLTKYGNAVQRQLPVVKVTVPANTSAAPATPAPTKTP